MSLEDLAPELIGAVYSHLGSIQDVVNLSLTCRNLHSMLPTSQKLAILFSVADFEMGPIQDIIQLVTENAAQATHVQRSPALSAALLAQISTIGKIGLKWEELYIKNRWGETDYIYRRCLTTHEKRMLRQAIYRYWLYSQVYHNRSYPRSTRLSVPIVHERCTLLRQWSTEELIYLLDLRQVFQTILQYEICPSDGDVYGRSSREAHFREEDIFNRRFTARGISMQSFFHDSHQSISRSGVHNLPAAQQRERLMAAWGDEISQYHVVQSMLKLNPSQILWLHDHAVYKSDVESYIDQHGGEWFWDNGETMLHSIILVLHDRGVDYQSLEHAIEDGALGIASNAPSEKYAELVSTSYILDNCD